MPRPRRVVIPGVPMHITQRGVDRGHMFLEDEDYARYRWALGEALSAANCALHAYVLMTNHVHMLVTPRTEDGPARMMRILGQRYVKYFNERYRRTGPLCDGRFRSSLIDSSLYFLSCSRYIESNPVRAEMVKSARSYEWSSIHHNCYGSDDPLLTESAEYIALGGTRSVRLAAYRAMFAEDVPRTTTAELRAAQRGRGGLYRTTYREAVDAIFRDRPIPQPGAGGRGSVTPESGTA